MKVISPVYPDHGLMNPERCQFQPCLNGPSSGPPHNYIILILSVSVNPSLNYLLHNVTLEAVPHIGNFFSKVSFTCAEIVASKCYLTVNSIRCVSMGEMLGS